MIDRLLDDRLAACPVPGLPLAREWYCSDCRWRRRARSIRVIVEVDHG